MNRIIFAITLVALAVAGLGATELGPGHGVTQKVVSEEGVADSSKAAVTGVEHNLADVSHASNIEGSGTKDAGVDASAAVETVAGDAQADSDSQNELSEPKVTKRALRSDKNRRSGSMGKFGKKLANALSCTSCFKGGFDEESDKE